MGNTKTSAPVVGVSDNTPPPVTPPNDLHPILVRVRKFIAIFVATVLAYWFLEAAVAANSNPQRGRGAQRALVKAHPPLPPPVVLAKNIRMMPNRHFLFLISACCSSMVVIWLTNLIGAANLPSVVDLPLDLPRVLDIVNESTRHLSRNVAVASSGVCYVKVGLELVDLVCKTSYGGESSPLTAAKFFPLGTGYVINDLVSLVINTYWSK